MDAINHRLKEMRLLKNMTLLEVADILNVKEATVQRYESGQIKNIKHETISQLANLYDCDPSYLMGWTNDKRTILTSKLSSEEKEIVTKYSELDTRGKHTVKTILDMEFNRITAEHLVPNAAHAIPGASEEDKQHDEDIMNDPDEWK